MGTIYWCQVFDKISTIGFLLMALGLTAIIPSFIMFLVNFDRSDDIEIKYFAASVNAVKLSLLIVFVGVVITVFVPNEKQLYEIYGIGGTIDYIKNDDTAKQLSDEVVVALDKYIDMLNEQK